jgi:hypothetical protein
VGLRRCFARTQLSCRVPLQSKTARLLREVHSRAVSRRDGGGQRRGFSCTFSQAPRLRRERPERLIKRAEGGTHVPDRLLATKRITPVTSFLSATSVSGSRPLPGTIRSRSCSYSCVSGTRREVIRRILRFVFMILSFVVAVVFGQFYRGIGWGWSVDIHHRRGYGCAAALPISALDRAVAIARVATSEFLVKAKAKTAPDSATASQATRTAFQWVRSQLRRAASQLGSP